jgi:hypothetical protein
MNYKENIDLQKLPECYSIEADKQYKLCDYYIASSAMTPCVGNQHYDYISTDIIIEVLQSGARFIQIPICEKEASPTPIPVIATAEYGQRIITSLNTLDIRTTFKAIRNNAFVINNKKTNYPLVIHLILNTTNTFTLNNCADVIKEIFNDILILPSNKYNEMPIFLEKLCNLLGKIIIFATPEYKNTKLDNFVIPIFDMFQSYHYSELSNVVMPHDISYKSEYNKKLSGREQTRSAELFKLHYPDINYIINHKNTIGSSIINDKNILDNLTSFNKVGMTQVNPHKQGDIISANYYPKEAIYLGCQFICMNYQINDDNMKLYLDIFKKNSFILKPSSMRFTETEQAKTEDLMKIYNSITLEPDNILNNIYYRHNNRLIALESFTLPGTYLTKIENNLRFQTGSRKTITHSKTHYNIGINQCFLLNKSTITQGTENISVLLETCETLGQYITFTGNNFEILGKMKNNKDLYNQSFYFEKSLIHLNDADLDMSNNPDTNNPDNDNTIIKLRTINPNNKQYLGFYNKQVKAYSASSQKQSLNNTSFKIHDIPFHISVKFITLFGGTVKTMGESIVGVLEGNTTGGTSYILEPINKQYGTGNNFRYYKDKFYLKNEINGTYLLWNENNFYLYDKLQTPDKNSIFYLEFSKGYYILKNNKDYQLCFIENNLLKFKAPNEIISNENMFKIDIKYILD